jgi:hypothetical protein
MWPQQVTMWGNQVNMHVQYSNTLINILRITETHMLTSYRPTLEWNGPGAFRSPSARAWPRTNCTYLSIYTTVAWIKFASSSLPVKVHPGKKNAIKKKPRQGLIGNLIPYFKNTVELFLIAVFFSGCTFTRKLQVPTSTIQFLWWGYRIVFYWYSLVTVPILWCPCYM